MKRGTSKHPKMFELATRLKVARQFAVGIIVDLWEAASNYAPRGDIGKCSDEWIAEQVGWSKKPDLLVQALVESRWLDRSECFRLLVHDWPEHCEDSVHKFLYRKKLLFADGTIPCTRKPKNTVNDRSVSGHGPDFDRTVTDTPQRGSGSGNGSGNSETEEEREEKPKNLVPFNELGFDKLTTAALKGGLAFSDGELPDLKARYWRPLDLDQKRAAFHGIQERIDAGEYPSYAPTLENYFRKQLWGRPIRASPQKPPDQKAAHIASLEARQAQLEREASARKQS